VRDLLLSPSTARFGFDRETVGAIPLGLEEEWRRSSGVAAVAELRIAGHVDSQHSFGAMVRAKWECLVTGDGTIQDARVLE